MTPANLLTELGIPFAIGGEHRHVRLGWLGIDCPWCNTSGKYHLGIPEHGTVAVCWRCGRHSLAEAIHETTRLPWDEIRSLVESLGRASKQVKSRPKRPGRIQVPNQLEPLSKPFKRYLRERGFDPDELTRFWSLQCTGPVGPLAWRLWIPVERDGQLASWTTRTIGNAKLRYIHASPEQERTPIKSTLYGEDYCRHVVIVCEGPADVWRIGPGAVATFGIGWTHEQAERLRRYPLRVICYDNETIAQQSARRLRRELNHYGQTEIVQLEAKDPGSANEEEIRWIRQEFGLTTI